MEKCTAKQIAEAVGIAPRNVRLRANKENWAHTLLTGRGGQIPHYYVDSLPHDIKVSVLAPFGINDTANHVAIAAARAITTTNKNRQTLAQQSKQQAVQTLAGLDGPAKARAEAAFTILMSATLFQKQSNLPQKAAFNEFATLYNERRIQLPEFAFKAKTSISRATLERWQATYNREGITGLAGKYGHAKGSGIIDSNEQINAFAIAMIKEYPHVKGEQLYEAIKASFPTCEFLPSAPTCRTWLTRWKQQNQELYTSLCDPSGWQNKYMAAFGNKAAEALHINHIWEFDSTPADVMLLDGRYSIIGVIDIYTRRVKCVLKKTSNSEGIALLMRETILEWGLPDIARTDNGSDYTSVHITSVFDALGIEQELTQPYSGWQKPFIERFFRTFSHGIAELLQGYVGHSVADREQISKRIPFHQRLMERRLKGRDKEAINVELSAEQFQQFINDWIDYKYHTKVHSELNCSPFERFTNSKATIRRLDNHHVLDVLLAPIPGNNGQRTVSKKDGIRIENMCYVHPELGGYIGQRVYCRWNPKDISKIYVFHALHHHFICEAVNPELSDGTVNLEDIARQAKELQRAKLREQRQALANTAKKHSVKDIAQQILAHQKQQFESLAAFPKPASQADSALINATQQAIEQSQQASEYSEYSEQQLSEFEAKRQQLQAAEQALAEDSTPIFRNEHHQARYLFERRLNGTATPEERAWLHQYQRAQPRQFQLLETLFEEDLKKEQHQ
ncbi:Mu transposase C-terminal domain-containing protein [Bowmanella denitrificans]|uniref:Mu transposase C-terminal domain-containing protein n=1 Tax=Bowmanella denitrificans TaxID=366582 RepID=UPI000C9AD47E|nr:Mu transposase C-terminal domain-containing protein [Bowmanella denitrificans]